MDTIEKFKQEIQGAADAILFCDVWEGNLEREDFPNPESIRQWLMFWLGRDEETIAGALALPTVQMIDFDELYPRLLVMFDEFDAALDD